jgi:hypothetical protein
MDDARDIRAKSLVAMVAGRRGGASVKPRFGVPDDTVRFGWAKNGPPAKPDVRVPFTEFDAMGDDAVMARLRSAWGL